MSAGKTARWLDLLAFLLQHRFPVTRDQIFTQVRGYDGSAESARRKFERDKDELKRLGLEIEVIERKDAPADEAGMGYRLAPAGTYLPHFELATEGRADSPYRGLRRLVLSDAELRILDRATRRLAERTEHPLSAEARAARRKLEFDLPLEAESIQKVLGLPIPEAGRKALALLQRAVADRVAVRLRRYSIQRDQDEDRVLEPYGLVFESGRWYVIGRDRDRLALRLFRVDRIRRAERIEGDEGSFEVPPGFDIREYTGRAPWELGEGPDTTVTVRFEFPEAGWVRNRRLGRPVAPGRGSSEPARFEFRVRDSAAFLRWLLPFGRRATVESPEATIAALEKVRREVAALYGEPGPDAPGGRR